MAEPNTPAVVEPPKNEHIFPATKLTELALQWKALTAAGKHNEAFVLLEEIIKDSTAMFERLAQYEGFHHTVELPQLVQAAREKVGRWLLACDVDKLRDKKLFSWFSTSVAGDTLVTLADGSKRRIDSIVEARDPVTVLAIDLQNLCFVPKQVNDWHKTPADPANWRKLHCQIEESYPPRDSDGITLTVTGDHEMLTKRGWVTVDELVTTDFIAVQSGDKLCWRQCRVTRVPEGEALTYRYDVSVPDLHNFIANSCGIHNCAKNAFRSEVAKQRQHTNRFHATSDSLERIAGAEDHAVDVNDAAAEARRKVRDITVRWGDPQELGAVRYVIDCVTDDERQPDKAAIINGAMYAYGLSPDLTKFFYQWALFALRDALYHKVRVPFTQQDVLRSRESYTMLPDVIDIVGWGPFSQLVVKMGGQRIKLPTIAQLARLHDDHLLHSEIDKTDLTPEDVEAVARRKGRTTRNAAEVYQEVSEELAQKRLGEHPLYTDEET